MEGSRCGGFIETFEISGAGKNFTEASARRGERFREVFLKGFASVKGPGTESSGRRDREKKMSQ